MTKTGKLSKIFQHNWIATFYLNFKMLPWKQAIKLPLDVYNKIRFEKLSGRIILNTDKVYRGMVKFGSQGSDMFQHKGCILAIEGNLVLNGSVVFGCSNTIKICQNGFIKIGKGSIFGADNLIYCKQRLEIGEGFLSSWNCQFMDSDTHNVTDVLSGKIYPQTKPIIIGRCCWIGNNVKINKGSKLPNNSIVASCSMINKDFSNEPDYCIFAGIPAKVIRKNVKWSL